MRFFVVELSCMCVCLSYENDYFKSTYPVTQQLARNPPADRNSWSSVCTLYDFSCLFVFLPYMSSAISFSLPLFLSVITLKSCTVLLSRSELLQNCSAIRNCEFLNKTFFFFVFHLVFGFYCGPLHIQPQCGCYLSVVNQF